MIYYYLYSKSMIYSKGKVSKMKKAIKNWFLEKHGYGVYGIKKIQENGFEILKETAKAVLVNIRIEHYVDQIWIPKSCLCEEWEHTFSPKAIGSAYHEYLVSLNKEEYRKGNLEEQRTFTSGRNVYDGASFRHQWTTKELTAELDYFNIKYMSKKEFAESL